jgi:hypothetical protein
MKHVRGPAFVYSTCLSDMISRPNGSGTREAAVTQGKNRGFGQDPSTIAQRATVDYILSGVMGCLPSRSLPQADENSGPRRHGP